MEVIMKRIALFILLASLLAITVGLTPAQDLAEVKYSYPGPIPEDVGLIQDAMNEILNAEIGVNLTLEPMDWGVYNDRMQLRLAAGEECDIIFTAPWINSYANNVSNGVLAPMDDLLAEHAPGLWASMPETTWDAARVNGVIYGVINQQIFPKPWGIEVRADLAEKYELDLDSIESFEDMEPWLVAVRDGEGITPIYTDDARANGAGGFWRSQYWGYDPIDDGIGAIVMRADDPDRTVVSTIETAEWLQNAELTQRWTDDGLFPLEPAPREEAAAQYRAGLFAFSFHVEKPGNDAELKNAYGHDFLIKNLTDPLILDTAGATATMNGICETSQNKEASMQVLEMFNTSVEIYNLLSRGIEGVHWEWVDQDNLLIGYPEGTDGDTSTYNPNTDWMFGNQFNAYYRDASQIGAWEATKVMNDTAFPSTALGFAVDRSTIETEIAQVNAVWDELAIPIENGWVPAEDFIEDATASLYDAGLQVIIDEVQRQIDEWAAANNK
jgi:putative aldouronate transport system substrate-binding protein